MADHYRKAVELLDEAEDLSTELDQAYAKGARLSDVADLQRRSRTALKRAEVHASLAVAQAMFEKGIGL